VTGAMENLHTIEGIHYKTGKLIEVVIRDEYIYAIHEIDNEERVNQIIAPGFVDIQINGYKGFDFNKVPLSGEEWKVVSQHLLEIGVTTFYPTIITNTVKQLSEIFKENMKVLKDMDMLNNVIGGFHLEGPYLSLQDGPRGAHNKKHIKKPDWEEFCNLQENAEGQIKLITLSPEWDNAAEFIERLTKSGVKVAIGHTNANSEQIREAVEAGAILSTHLGNGAHITLPRHPNYIWDQLAEDNLWSSVISDGHHLPSNVLKVINQVKEKKMILISDSVALAGKEPGNYNTSVGGEVTVTENGRLHLRNEPNLLAGSAKNLLQGVQHFVQKGIGNMKEGINKASIYPASLMDLPVKDGLTVGAPADLIVLNQNHDDWKVIQTIKYGKKVKDDKL